MSLFFFTFFLRNVIFQQNSSLINHDCKDNNNDKVKTKAVIHRTPTKAVLFSVHWINGGWQRRNIYRGRGGRGGRGRGWGRGRGYY